MIIIIKQGEDSLILKGRLKSDKVNNTYTLSGYGKVSNVTDILNVMLFDNVSVKIQQMHGRKLIFYENGELLKKRILPKTYLYHLGENNLELVLMDNAGKELILEISNTTVEK